MKYSCLPLLDCAGCTWIFPSSPVLSILLATFTVLPQMSYWGFLAPITPAITGPWLMPVEEQPKAYNSFFIAYNVMWTAYIKAVCRFGCTQAQLEERCRFTRNNNIFPVLLVCSDSRQGQMPTDNMLKKIFYRFSQDWLLLTHQKEKLSDIKQRRNVWN